MAAIVHRLPCWDISPGCVARPLQLPRVGPSPRCRMAATGTRDFGILFEHRQTCPQLTSPAHLDINHHMCLIAYRHPLYRNLISRADVAMLTISDHQGPQSKPLVTSDRKLASPVASPAQIIPTVAPSPPPMSGQSRSLLNHKRELTVFQPWCLANLASYRVRGHES